MRSLDPNASDFNEHYAALGRFIVSFQQIEGVIIHWLSVLTAHPSRVSPNNMIQAMLTHSSFNNLQRFTGLVSELLDPARLFEDKQIDSAWREMHSVASERLNSALKRVQKLEERRNQLVHSEWFTNATRFPESGQVFRVKHRMKKGQFALWHEEVSAASILGEARRCTELAAELNAALREFHGLNRQYLAAEGDEAGE